jgi:hypothetical protein
MSDDWWIFVATIDREALLQERFGSPAHNAMVEKHAKKVRDLHHAFDPAEWARAQMEVAEWNGRRQSDRKRRDAANRAYKAQRDAARAARKAA